MSYTITIGETDTLPAAQRRQSLASSEISVSRSGTANETSISTLMGSTTRSPGKREGGKRSEAKLIRRLRGFFIQEEDDQARVAFIQADKLVHYYLPLDRFKAAGVMVENQPFEMDEFELSVNGTPFFGYEIRPSAKPEDSFVAPLPLDQQTQSKLTYLLGRRDAQH